MSLAIARMHALALAHHHGWAQKFNKYLPPVTMEEALAAHKEAQDADEDHRIVVPSLTHTTGSGRTSWQIAEDGAVTATIYDITPSGDEWGDYTLTERARLTVAPDGMEVTTVEYKINFLAAFQGGELQATGRVLKSGKRIIVTMADVAHVAPDGQPTACAVMQQTLVPVAKTY